MSGLRHLIKLRELMEQKEKENAELWMHSFFLSPNECNTACCAIGYASQDKYFNMLGLYREIGSVSPIFMNGIDKYAYAWEWASDVFEITEEEALYLFYDYQEYEGNSFNILISRLNEIISRYSEKETTA